MAKLQFVWEAKFKDNSVIKQFENGTEHLFKEVKDRFNDLVLFSFKHISKPLVVSVDLQKGLLFLNNAQTPYEDLIKEKIDIRLIVFRRHKVTTEFNTLKEVEHKLNYFIGYQYVNKHGNNRKVILQLDSEGNIIIGD